MGDPLLEKKVPEGPWLVLPRSMAKSQHLLQGFRGSAALINHLTASSSGVN